MMGAPSERVAGVYLVNEDGAGHLVHRYVDDGYELWDVHELMALGRTGQGGALILTVRELRLLHVTANAQSFDHAPEFISMCLDMAATPPPPGVTSLRFVSEG